MEANGICRRTAALFVDASTVTSLVTPRTAGKSSSLHRSSPMVDFKGIKRFWSNAEVCYQRDEYVKK